MFKKTQTLGEIVSQFPQAKTVFEAHQIDYCCGGDRTLETGLKDTSLTVEAMIQTLNEHYNNSTDQETTNWQTAPINTLVDHILVTHHAFLNEYLPLISQLTKKILSVHGDGHRELFTVYQTFHTLKTDMEMHLVKEETQQYPAITNYLNTDDSDALKNAVQIIDELEDDHTGAGDLLKALRQITNNFTVPDDGCETYQKTYQLLEALEQNTFTHIHLENNILFKRLKRLLDNEKGLL